MLRKKQDALKSGELTAAENVQRFLDVIRKRNGEVNALLHVSEDALAAAQAVDKKIRQGKAGALAGLAIAVKSNISVLDMPVTCASKALEKYRGTFDADVVRRIREEDGIIIGMTNMDEFACGNTGETSAFGPTQNPAAPGRVPGGSSSGSAAAVAAGMCDLALGSDTGGSVRNPASHCGIVGIKPSYGRVSRYGLVDMAMSLEGIGTFANDVEGNALLLEAIAGPSPNDGVTAQKKAEKYTTAKEGTLTVGVSADFEKLCSDEKIYEAVRAKAEKLGVVKNVRLQHVNLAVQAYYPLVYVEFFSGTRKFDGRKYGKRIEDACGEEVLRRILGGREISRAEHHGRYYRKALQAKQQIAADFSRAFREVDVIAVPTTPNLPQKMGGKADPFAAYAEDAFTVPANLAGICGGVVPAGKVRGVPVGLQLLAPLFGEMKLVRAMQTAQSL